jgi:hypothetical protein
MAQLSAFQQLSFPASQEVSIAYEPPYCVMNTDDATAGDKLASICAMCSQSVKHLHQTRTTVLAVNERPVPTANIYIHRNQNGCHEQGKSNIKGSTAVMPTKADAKQHEDEKSSSSRKTKHEEENRNADAYRNFNKARSRRLLSLRIHNVVR